MADRRGAMKLGKRTKQLLASGAVLLAIQVVTYWLFAEQAMPVAALTHLREYRWLERSRFALFPQKTWDALTPSQQQAVARELKRRAAVIYHSTKEIPDASLYTRPITEKDIRSYERAKNADLELLRGEIKLGRRVVGYVDGVQIEWHLERHGLFWMDSEASIWASIEGAEARGDIYIWLFGWWVRVWNLYHAVA
jgi:hypothetical protein